MGTSPRRLHSSTLRRWTLRGPVLKGARTPSRSGLPPRPGVVRDSGELKPPSSAFFLKCVAFILAFRVVHQSGISHILTQFHSFSRWSKPQGLCTTLPRGLPRGLPLLLPRAPRLCTRPDPRVHPQAPLPGGALDLFFFNAKTLRGPHFPG